MSNTINNLTTSNTFLQWLTTTQSLVSRLNILTEGGNTQTFQANTNIDIANNVTIGGNLTVSGNITLDAIGFDDLIVSGGATIGTTLDVSGNTTLTNTTITYGVLLASASPATLPKIKANTIMVSKGRIMAHAAPMVVCLYRTLISRQLRM